MILFMAAAIWGVAFVAQSVGMDYVGPYTFIAARNVIALLVLLPWVVLTDRNRRKKGEQGRQKEDHRSLLTGGICCGICLFAASTLQQFGMKYTTVGKAGFITTLYIILVPFFGIFLKKKIPGKVWAGAAIAAFGMYLLCMSESLSLGRGDTLVFLCAVLFSVHILVICLLYTSDAADD